MAHLPVSCVRSAGLYRARPIPTTVFASAWISGVSWTLRRVRATQGETMGILDGFLKQAMGGRSSSGGIGGLISVIASKTQILAALAALLSTRDTSVGGGGGLGGLLNSFRHKGLGD